MSLHNHNHAKNHLSAKVITTGAIFTVLALIFSYIEFLIPISIGVPGVKLGLANLVIIIALYQMGFKWAVLIDGLRVVLAGLLFTGAFAMLYSLAGASVSILMMGLLKKTNRFSMIGVSMAGGVAHNFGQIVIAAIIVQTSQLFLYFPVLLFSGVIAGIAVGIVAVVLNDNLRKTVFRK